MDSASSSLPAARLLELPLTAGFDFNPAFSARNRLALSRVLAHRRREFAELRDHAIRLSSSRRDTACRLAFYAGLAVCALAAPAAYAQRTGDNVTTQSSDAFGRSVGSERNGLYNADDVRGFNPVDAGNARIEGLYFDQLDRLSPRINEGSAIRLGFSALHYPFPAPTGLVDYRITKSLGRRSLSVDFDNGSPNILGFGGSAEFKLPLHGEQLGLSGGAGLRNGDRTEGGQSLFRTFGGTLSWEPGTGAELLAFGGGFLTRSDEARPTFFPADAQLPPHLKRGTDLSQPWTPRHADNLLAGSVVRFPLGGWRVQAGLFDAWKNSTTIYADLFGGVTADGRAASRVIVADANARDHSLSGELRLSRELRTGDVSHTFVASVRGRAKERLFGGSARIALGPSTLLVSDPRPAPSFTLGPKNHDTVRQITAGLAYGLAWKERGTIDLGVSKSRYRKVVDFADPTLADPTTRDDPLLWNLAVSVWLGKRLTLFVSTARGQEEALIAPDIAVNRSEAPPAIRTRQIEAGVRFAVTNGVGLVAGVFKIDKPYFNLDRGLRYRQLGALSNRGLELSLTGQLAPGLTIVGGTLFLDPRIAGEAVSRGLIGPRPVGQIRRRSVANLDFRTAAGKGAWSFDLGIESLSGRTANAANTLAAPGHGTVNLGARYRFAAGPAKLLLRPLVANLLNDYGWNVSSSGGFTYTAPRAFTLQLVADF